MKLKARKSQGKCVICWQYFKRDAKEVGNAPNHPRARMKFQGKDYHRGCWLEAYKTPKKAKTKKATHKRSF